MTTQAMTAQAPAVAIEELLAAQQAIGPQPTLAQVLRFEELLRYDAPLAAESGAESNSFRPMLDYVARTSEELYASRDLLKDLAMPEMEIDASAPAHVQHMLRAIRESTRVSLHVQREVGERLTVMANANIQFAYVTKGIHSVANGLRTLLQPGG